MQTPSIFPAIMMAIMLCGCGGEAQDSTSKQQHRSELQKNIAEHPEGWETRCNKERDGVACTALGTYNLELQDRERAHEFWQKGCDFGDGDGCALRGAALLKGYGVKRNPSVAADLFISGCDQQRKSALSCFSAGKMFANGHGIKKNMAMAGKYYGSGCNLNMPQSCMALGSMFERGQGLRQNLAHAAKLYEKACALDHGPACISLGKMYAKGHGIDKDEASAKEFFGRACDLGEQSGCSSYRRINEAQMSSEK